MRKKVFILCCLIVLLFSLFFSQVLALQEETHKAININIAERTVNGFSLDTYLIHNLGFIDGYKQKFGGVDSSGGSVKQSIAEWLGYGGEQEDRPGSILDYLQNKPTRSVNHFHNPLKHWSEAGLNEFLGFYTGESSVLWSQNPNQHIGGKWSWQDARNYFYSALTSMNKTQRDEYFAKTFRAAGQLMHLVQDASVPEHVRNDAHVFPAYEAYVEKKRPALWNNWINNPIFDKSILNIATVSSAPVPISRIIDTDFYNSQNPDITTNSKIGLAEYTNANFLSPDTMFTDDLSSDDRHYFPYPRAKGASLWADTSNILPRLYLKKTDEGESVGHLAVVSLLYKYRDKYFPQYYLHIPVALDDECKKEYASKLIPRAVGYSAGLLNYFFRGDVEMAPDDSTGSGYVIVNNTDEDMNGTFELYYDNNSDERIRINGWSLSIGKKSSGNNKSTNIAFTKPDNMKEDGKYMLVFRGKLGNEEDAVAGRSVELKGGDYLFLVSVLSRKIQSFKIGISNGSYQLAPAEVNVNLTCSTDTGYPSSERILGRNLTIQSNPEKTEHYAVLPTVKLDAKGTPVYETYRDYIDGYGVGQKDYCWSWWLGYVCEYTYPGSPFTYRPKDFTKGSEYILEKPGSQLLSDMYITPQPVATGRKSYTLDSEGKMTSYQNSIWRKYISGYAYQYYFRYKEKIGGEWIDGNTLAVDEPMPYPSSGLVLKHTPIAFIDRNKALIISAHTEEIERSPIITNLSATLHLVSVTPGTCTAGGKTINTVQTQIRDWVENAVATGYSGDQYVYTGKLQLGNETLEETTYHTGGSRDGHPNFYHGEDWSGARWVLVSTTASYSPDCDYNWWANTIGSTTYTYNDFGVKKGYFPDPVCEYCGSMQYSDYEDYERGERIPEVIDYDNRDGEKTFIIFYKKSIIDKRTWGKRSFFGDDGDAPLEAYHDSSYDDKYIMAYRINGGAVTSSEIATAHQEIIESQAAIDYDPPTNSFTYDYNPPWTETWSGQRVTAVSCQTYSDAIVYTYIIEKRVDDKWVFDKRVVGIINISDKSLPVGHRQEFDLDFSGTAFDPKSLAAIGVTR